MKPMSDRFLGGGFSEDALFPGVPLKRLVSDRALRRGHGRDVKRMSDRFLDGGFSEDTLFPDLPWSGW